MGDFMTRRKKKQLGEKMNIYHFLRGRAWKSKWARRLQECDYMKVLVTDSLFDIAIKSSKDTKPPAESICEMIYNGIDDALRSGKISMSDTPVQRLQFFIDNYGYYCPAICSWFVRLKPIFARNSNEVDIAH